MPNFFLVLLLTNKEMLKGVLKKTNFKHISHGRDDDGLRDTFVDYFINCLVAFLIISFFQ